MAGSDKAQTITIYSIPYVISAKAAFTFLIVYQTFCFKLSSHSFRVQITNLSL